jgi:alkylation response protein AidB-like acyl-CoA dehydrogenase
MNFDWTGEQLMLRESLERFGAQHYLPGARRSLLAQGAAGSRMRWKMMAEFGWLALALPDACGGLGGTSVDVMALMEVFGRHLMLEPYVTSCIFAPALLAHASSGTVSRVLDGIATGDVQVSPALAEPGSGFNLNRVATSAARAAGVFRISGTKSYAENGADADWFIVPARTAGTVDERAGISLFLVPHDAPGLRCSGFRGVDHHRHASLQFDAVAVGTDALLGPLDGGLPLLEAAVDRAIAAHLAEAVGSMEALREMTLAYLKSRRQFGVTIGSFQALQHRMVDIAVACEEARSMTYHATLRLGADPAGRRRAVSAAKARVGQTGLFVGRESVQLHGGVGTSDELMVSHHLKRLMMIDLAYGNADHHRALFADCA